MSLGLAPGDLLTGLEIGPVAHGGHFVARDDGRVVFVRHGLTGELVDARVTSAGSRFARADVVRVHRASPHRVAPPCPLAGRCGGCDFQHVAPAHARELKRQVVVEQLRHLAGYEFTGEVAEELPAPFGWRSRMRYHLDGVGRPGLLAHRSDQLVTLPEAGCLIAAPQIGRPPADPARPGAELIAIAAAGHTVFTDPASAATVTERVGERSYQVAATGFWQPHAAAPAVLTERVLAGLAPLAGELALDLYCGVGLFAGSLAGAGVTVYGVEADRRAVALAAANVPAASFLAGDVAVRLRQLPPRADLVVLDPPRSGAGTRVLAAVAARQPRAIAYVACDPAALGRDLAIAAGLGYRPSSLTAHDLFPMTHHVECVAILER